MTNTLSLEPLRLRPLHIPARTDLPLRAFLKNPQVEAPPGFTKEYVALHKTELTKDIRQPAPGIETALAQFMIRHPRVTLDVIFALGALFLICAMATFIGLCTPFWLIPIVATAVILYRMGTYTLVTWNRVPVEPDSLNIEIPEAARMCMVRIQYFAKEAGLDDVSFEVESPSSEKVPDPILYVMRRASNEEYPLYIWVNTPR